MVSLSGSFSGTIIVQRGHVISCCWSTVVSRVQSQRRTSISCFICWQTWWKWWFHFPGELGSCWQLQRNQELLQWQWCDCLWAWSPERNYEALSRGRWETLDPVITSSTFLFLPFFLCSLVFECSEDTNVCCFFRCIYTTKLWVQYLGCHCLLSRAGVICAELAKDESSLISAISVDVTLLHKNSFTTHWRVQQWCLSKIRIKRILFVFIFSPSYPYREKEKRR